MAVKPHATHWPNGTRRSTANAFGWRERQAAGIDSIIAQDSTCCTSLYNAWRADQRAGHGKGAHMTWAQYRDTQTPRARSFAHRAPGGQTNGFGANGSTIVGLSPKADKMLASQGKLMPIKGRALQKGKVLAPTTSRKARKVAA